MSVHPPRDVWVARLRMVGHSHAEPTNRSPVWFGWITPLAGRQDPKGRSVPIGGDTEWPMPNAWRMSTRGIPYPGKSTVAAGHPTARRPRWVAAPAPAGMPESANRGSSHVSPLATHHADAGPAGRGSKSAESRSAFAQPRPVLRWRPADACGEDSRFLVSAVRADDRSTPDRVTLG